MRNLVGWTGKLRATYGPPMFGLGDFWFDTTVPGTSTVIRDRKSGQNARFIARMLH